MYEEFFGLRRRPFAAAPSAEAYIPTPAMEHARKGLIRTIERGDGPALVIGPAGSGKSLLGQILAQHFNTRFSVALLNSARLDSCRSLLQNILYELELPYRELEEGEMRLSLVDFLRRNDACPRGVLLVVDEAHLLPLRLLEEIRLITNIVEHGVSRVRLVLIGGPQLEERFTSPKLESFNQRIAARCYLQALNLEETSNYIQQMLTQSGSKTELFAADAVKAVYRASDGIPRLINQVCDQALMLTFLTGTKQVTVAAVEEAWSDLQQLPTPWQNPRIENQIAAATAAETIIEFGSLEDDDVPFAMASPSNPFAYDADPVDRSEVQLDLLTNGLADYADEPAMSPMVIGRSPVEWLETHDFPCDPGLSSSPFTLSLTSFDASEPRQTEVELSFSSRRDVFGHDFHEEEHVIDHYAGLQSSLPQPGAVTNRSESPLPIPAAAVRQEQPASISFAASSLNLEAAYHSVQMVDCPTTFGIAAEITPQIASSGGSIVNVVDTFSNLIPPPGKSSLPKVAAEAFDPASDPVTPELVPFAREQADEDRPQRDDREILLIEGAHHPRGSAASRSKRLEYKQLFTSLRKV